MTDTKFTPGPWLVVGSIPEEGVDCFWIKAQPHPAMRGLTKDIGTVDGYQDDPEREANAHLIAAAPELYQAIDSLLAIVGDSQGVVGYHLNGDIAEWDEFEEVAQAFAALAKVRGES